MSTGTRAEGDCSRAVFLPGRRSDVATTSVADPRRPGDRIGGRYAKTLPDAELRERLLTILAPSRAVRADNRQDYKTRYKQVWTIPDLAALALISDGDVKRVIYDSDVRSAAQRQRLSQAVLRIDAGLLVKRDGRILKLSEPQRPVVEIRRAVVFDYRGRPSLAPTPDRKVKPLFSALMKDWFR